MTDKLANRSISDALPRTVKIETEDEDDLVKVMADKYRACRCEFQLNYEQELAVTVLLASKDTCCSQVMAKVSFTNVCSRQGL